MSRHKPKRLKKSNKYIYFWTTCILLIVLSILVYIRCNTQDIIPIEPPKITTTPKLPSTITPEPTMPTLTKIEPKIIEEPVHTPEPVLYYTPEEVDIVAKILYREARGINSDTEIACVAWVICNRVDAGYGDTIKEVATAQHQFAWIPDTPLEDELIQIAYDVLNRWSTEQQYGTCDGRVLPAEYLFFHGDGQHNYFRTQYEKDGSYYDYSLSSPYDT